MAYQELSIFNFTLERLQEIDNVGPAKAQQILELVERQRNEKKDVKIEDLKKIAKSAPWEQLVKKEKIFLMENVPSLRDIMSSIHILMSEFSVQKQERELEKEENERKEKERIEREEFEKDEMRKEQIEKERVKDKERVENERVIEEERKQQWERQSLFLQENFDRLDIRMENAIQKVRGHLEERFDSLQTRVCQLESCIPPPSMPSQTSFKSDDTQDKTLGFMRSISDTIEMSTKNGRYHSADRPSKEYGYSKFDERTTGRQRNKQPKQRDSSESPERRRRSHSPPVPRMQSFSGNPEGLRFEVFRKRFLQIATRRGWNGEKQYYRFLDCLTDQALDYALSATESENLPDLLALMAVRFDFKEEPITARQKLAVLKQDSETEEEFLHKVQKLAHDGYPAEIEHGLVSRIITEAFLRGIRNKEAALYAVGRSPNNAQEALQLIKSFVAHAKALGVGKQVTFQQKAVSLTIETQLLEALDKLMKSFDRMEQKLEKGLRSGSPYRNSSFSRDRDERSRSPNRYENRDQRRVYSPSPRRDQGYSRDRRYNSPQQRDYHRDDRRDDRYDSRSRDRSRDRYDRRSRDDYDNRSREGYQKSSRDDDQGKGQSRQQVKSVSSSKESESTLNSQELAENAIHG